MNEIVVSSVSINNLHNLSCKIPKNSLIAVVGPSGSGKSSFVFDFLANKSKELYLAPFLDGKIKTLPADGTVVGSSFPIVLDLKRSNKQKETLISEFLGLEYKIKSIFNKKAFRCCPECKQEISTSNFDNLFEKIEKKTDSTIEILIPIQTSYVDIEKIFKLGFSQAYFQDDIVEIEKLEALILEGEVTEFELIVNSFYLGNDAKNKILKAIEIAKELNCFQLLIKVNKKKYLYSLGSYCLNCKKKLSENDFLLIYNNYTLNDFLRLAIGEVLRILSKEGYFFPIEVSKLIGHLRLDSKLSEILIVEFKFLVIFRCLLQAPEEFLILIDEPGSMLTSDEVLEFKQVFKELSKNNTLIFVEHNDELIRSADYIIEFGPGAGRQGGRIVFEGSQNKYKKFENYLNNTEANVVKEKKEFKINALNIVRGSEIDSESDQIHSLIKKIINKKVKELESIKQVSFVSNFTKMYKSTSTVGIVSGLYHELIKLFAQTNEAKMRGYTKDFFDFTKKQGYCQLCSGSGYQLKFDSKYLCDFCLGKKFNQKVKDVLIKGLNIIEVLDLSIAELKEFFHFNQKIMNKISLIQKLGISYLVLSQAASTLSTGEKHRLEILEILNKLDFKNRLFLINGLSKGLSSEELKNFVNVINDIINQGATFVLFDNSECLGEQGNIIFNYI